MCIEPELRGAKLREFEGLVSEVVLRKIPEAMRARNEQRYEQGEVVVESMVQELSLLVDKYRDCFGVEVLRRYGDHY